MQRSTTKLFSPGGGRLIGVCVTLSNFTSFFYIYISLRALFNVWRGCASNSSFSIIQYATCNSSFKTREKSKHFILYSELPNEKSIYNSTTNKECIESALKCSWCIAKTVFSNSWCVCNVYRVWCLCAIVHTEFVFHRLLLPSLPPQRTCTKAIHINVPYGQHGVASFGCVELYVGI